jgi:hypothetical protein
MPNPPIDLSAVYTPHAKQQLIHDSKAQTKVFEIARRFGKSRAALFELLRRWVEALEIPVPVSVVPPWQAWIVTPTFPLARQVWTELNTFIPNRMIRNKLQDEMIIELEGNEMRQWGEIHIKSAFTPEALQTAGLNFLWVSEAQDVSQESFEKLLPTTRDSSRFPRWIIYEGIPAKTKDHWFRKMVERAARDKSGHIELFKGTVYENPMLTDEIRHEIEEDKEILPDATWRRMYLAEFDADAGGLRNIDACIAGDLLDAPIPGNRYVGGLDLGRQHDATVLHIFDAQKRTLVGHQRWDPGFVWAQQREETVAICTHWEIHRLVVDATGMGGDMYLEAIGEMGLPVEPFNIDRSTREPLLTALQVALERETIHFPPVPSMLRELRNLQPRKSPTGLWRLEAGVGYHDDEVFAMALGLTACDPPHSEGQHGMSAITRMSYLPKGNGGSGSEGVRMMRDAKTQKIRERMERAGVEV